MGAGIEEIFIRNQVLLDRELRAFMMRANLALLSMNRTMRDTKRRFYR